MIDGLGAMTLSSSGPGAGWGSGPGWQRHCEHIAAARASLSVNACRQQAECPLQATWHLSGPRMAPKPGSRNYGSGEGAVAKKGDEVRGVLRDRHVEETDLSVHAICRLRHHRRPVIPPSCPRSVPQLRGRHGPRDGRSAESFSCWNDQEGGTPPALARPA